MNELDHVIAIGSNVAAPDGTVPLKICNDAVDRMGYLEGLRLIGRSRWYRSVPVPPSEQPDFVNGVALLRGRADPAALLAALQAIEAQAGRERSVPNAARTLDLDIVAIGGLVRSAPDPVVPHPRMHLREFVLRPMAEVAPDWVHPVLGRTVAALLAGLAPQGVVPL